jgi:hypothetical protein
MEMSRLEITTTLLPATNLQSLIEKKRWDFPESPNPLQHLRMCVFSSRRQVIRGRNPGVMPGIVLERRPCLIFVASADQRCLDPFVESAERRQKIRSLNRPRFPLLRHRERQLPLHRLRPPSLLHQFLPPLLGLRQLRRVPRQARFSLLSRWSWSCSAPWRRAVSITWFIA